MKDEKKFSDRLKELVGDEDVKPFARKCGAQEKSIRLYLKGGVNPTLPNILKIAKACNVSVGWLANGEGPKDLSKLAAVMKEGGVPVPDDDNLRTVFEWLVDECGGDPAGQMLLVESLLKSFPSFREFLEKKAKAPVAVGGSHRGRSGSDGDSDQEQAAG